MTTKHALSVGDRSVRVSNLDKVFYPKCGFTKGQVIDYYIRIAPVLLTHLARRALSLKRYPDGVEGGFFYEKRCPAHAPDWVCTTGVKKSDGSTLNYCVLNDLPSLVWAANIANLELHPFLHRINAPKRPTTLMFDLDPGPPADLIDCCEVALRLKAFFEQLQLVCFAKTSGSKGMQLVVPLNTPVTYRSTKAFARKVAETFAARFPKQVVSDMKKSLRKGKVLIDWSQNDDGKTTVCAYSLRARERPTVSTPLRWKEVKAALQHRDAKRLSFTSNDVLQRVKKLGDLYAPVAELQQMLPKL